MSPGRDHRAALVFVLALALPLSVTACAKGDPPQSKAPGHTTIAKRASVAPISKQAVEVEASCGQCNFGLAEPQGCDLAVRIQGKAYFVDGAHIDDHGDAHAERGLCNAVRRAAVTGQVVDNRYQATSFRLVD